MARICSEHRFEGSTPGRSRRIRKKKNLLKNIEYVWCSTHLRKKAHRSITTPAQLLNNEYTNKISGYRLPPTERNGRTHAEYLIFSGALVVPPVFPRTYQN